MVLGFKEDSNTQRCPKCGWVSTKKFTCDFISSSLAHNEVGVYFACANSQCSVVRIYSDNCVMEANNGQTNSRD